MKKRIIEILKSYPDHVTARRWLQNEKAIEVLEQAASDWNKDHEIMGYPDMIYTIETHIEIYLDQPELIELFINQNSRPE